MKIHYLLVILTLLSCTKTLHLMTPSVDFDTYDFDTIDFYIADELDVTNQKPLINDNLDRTNFLEQLSNILIERVSDNQLENLIQLLTDHVLENFTDFEDLLAPRLTEDDSLNNKALKDLISLHFNAIDIFSILQKNLSLNDLSFLLGLLNRFNPSQILDNQESLLPSRKIPSPSEINTSPTHVLAPVSVVDSVLDNSSVAVPTQHCLSKKIYPCNQCNHKPFADRSGLFYHKRAKHKGVKYQCDLCKHKPFANPASLLHHKRTEHEGIIYQCDQCSHKPFANPASLAKHIKSKHKGVTYQCNQCSHKPFMDSSGLLYHKRTKHKNVIY